MLSVQTLKINSLAAFDVNAPKTRVIGRFGQGVGSKVLLSKSSSSHVARKKRIKVQFPMVYHDVP